MAKGALLPPTMLTATRGRAVVALIVATPSSAGTKADMWRLRTSNSLAAAVQRGVEPSAGFASS